MNPTVSLGSGDHTFTLTVTDNNGAVNTDTVTISVNAPPVANAGPDQALALVGDDPTVRATLDASGSTDSDGTIVKYIWTGVEATPVETTIPLMSLDLTPGTHIFSLIVQDDDGALSLADEVTIVVTGP